MRFPHRPTVIAALVLLPALPLNAQTAPDPSGHWAGSVDVPGVPPFEVDLARNSAGALVGAVSVAAQGVKGLPLQKVVVEGTYIAFHALTDEPFTSVLSADGPSLQATSHL